MNARAMLWIPLLVSAIGSCTSQYGDLTGTDSEIGSLSVGVTITGSSDFGITVLLRGPQGFPPRTAAVSPGGIVTFTDLAPGAYTVSTAIFGFDCQSVSASVEASRTTTATIACTRRTPPDTGIVAGVVTSGEAPISGASVELAGTGVAITRITGANGELSFVGVKAGEYTLTALHQHFTCPVQTILVDPSQRTTVAISCSPKTTGWITGTVIVGSDTGWRVFDATVNLTGPASRTAIGGSQGTFAVDELPPGTYTVNASARFMTCQPLSADVRAASTTAVQISCTFRFLIGSEIEGNWHYDRLLRSQTGNCPPPLPETGTGSMTFHSSIRSLEIVGLDPALAIVGVYDEDTGFYAGTGAAVSGDGSSLQTDVALFFDFDVWGFLAPFFYTEATPTSVWTRRHRDPSGTLVCTEVYGASGWRLSW